MTAVQRLRGTADWLPQDLPRLRRAEQAGLAVARAFGYGEIATPVIEPTELFTRGVGDTTDIVTHQMYTFTDLGGRSVSLRPEGTAAVLRAFAESSLRQAPRPVRLAYAGPMFRHDRPGRGRFRQFHQLGVEAIGEADPELDAEVIAVAWDWLRRLGIEGTTLALNSIGDATCRPLFRAALLAHLAPHRDRLAPLDRERLGRNPLRLLDSKDASLRAILASGPQIAAFLCPACRDALARVEAGLRAYGIPYQVEPQLVRGLDYYVRTTFEVWHQSLEGAQNALLGGGRYDGLLATLGFPDAPGVGFAAGLERIALLTGMPPADGSGTVAVCSIGAAAVAAAIRLGTALRGRGLVVVADVGPRSARAKLRGADGQGAAVACLLGDDELRDATVTVRDLRAQRQERVAVADAPDRVAATLAAGAAAG
ncbi:MAG TPA: histidine--tRNA ligase [Candidatus Micrarchaeia archaeon]|nr:histidine--tRNA ligase [Candidatus Micrarchaeia archaeon]